MTASTHLTTTLGGREFGTFEIAEASTGSEAVFVALKQKGGFAGGWLDADTARNAAAAILAIVDPKPEPEPEPEPAPTGPLAVVVRAEYADGYESEVETGEVVTIVGEIDDEGDVEVRTVKDACQAWVGVDNLAPVLVVVEPSVTGLREGDLVALREEGSIPGVVRVERISDGLRTSVYADRLATPETFPGYSGAVSEVDDRPVLVAVKACGFPGCIVEGDEVRVTSTRSTGTVDVERVSDGVTCIYWPANDLATPENAPGYGGEVKSDPHAFAAGDLVDLYPTARSYDASHGARARVVEYPAHFSDGYDDGVERVRVEWLSGHGRQSNGIYPARDFAKAADLKAGDTARVLADQPLGARLMTGDLVRVERVFSNSTLRVRREATGRAWFVLPEHLRRIG